MLLAIKGSFLREMTIRMTAFVFVMMFGGIVVAQEGATTLPNNYKVRFENEWVKVTAVRYEPMQKLAPHTHTPDASAYVYLNDGPPVIFRHVGGKGMAATRAATTAGAFRVYKGLVEVHEVENTGNAPSEFLRVELKTTALQPATFAGKFERPATPTAEPVTHFDHPQAAISRVRIQPNQEIEIASSDHPVLVIALAPGAGIEVGQSKWLDAAGKMRVHLRSLPHGFNRQTTYGYDALAREYGNRVFSLRIGASNNRHDSHASANVGTVAAP